MVGEVERKLDDLGRLVLPAEIRRAVKLEAGGVVNIRVTGPNQITLTIRSPQRCRFCESEENLLEAPYGYICMDCLRAVMETAERGKKTAAADG